MNIPIGPLCDAVKAETERAIELHGEFHSAHEGYAVILEELEELWREVMKNKAKRTPERMRDECIQIAAMAVKFAARFGK